MATRRRPRYGKCSGHHDDLTPPPQWEPLHNDGRGGQRPLSPEGQLQPHQHYPPPSAGYTAALKSCDQPRYEVDSSCSRPGSISASTRSTADLSHVHFQPVNGNVATHEVMPGQQPGPLQGHYGQPPRRSVNPSHTPVYGSAYHPAEEAGYGQHRRNPSRAAQACESCRERKAKCDEGRPICENCKNNGLNCSYRDVKPTKQEQQAAQLYGRLKSISVSMTKVFESSQHFLSRLDSQSEQLERLQSRLLGDQRESFRYPKLGSPAMSSSTAYVEQNKKPHSAVQQHTRSLQGHQPEISDTDDDALPLKHFTAAQTLLEWPSVRALLPKDFNQSTYVLDLELGRDPLILYGCGEGEVANDGREGPASPVNSHTSSSESQHNEQTSIASPDGVRGSGQLPARPAGITLGGRDHPGGVGPMGGFILDAQVVDQHFKSYMANIHILHPFLEARVLRDMITLFKTHYSWDFVPRATSRNVGTSKRKRDTDRSPGSFERPRRSPNDRVEIVHSVTNAIVLLVVALGKICAHEGPLPGCAQTTTMSTSTLHNHFSDGFIASLNSTPSSSVHSCVGRMDEVQVKVSSPADSQGKKLEVIPGLAYFSQAASIIGKLPGGSSVSHVQANILAGLYMSQLARILPAHHYFSNASRGCIVLIESREYKDKENMEQAKRNLINFAFWTCLQLESDILAEVELPPSGISRYESQMDQELPSRVTLDPIQESSDMYAALRFYSYQVALRRELNRVHKELYVHKAPDRFDLITQTLQQTLDENLEAWRRGLDDYNWDDAHHKSSDINVARMRAKYYGAKYIIHRPALAFAIYHLSGSTPRNRSSESPMGPPRSQQPSTAMHRPAPDSRYPRAGSEMRPPSKVSDLPDWIKQSAKTCIDAAIRSTTVFDSVPDRLIITNIFGTAHAQFGNMLVLAATFKSDLDCLVKREDLMYLLNRTIKFLRFSEAISPTLAQNAKVLSEIQKRIFPCHSSSVVNG